MKSGVYCKNIDHVELEDDGMVYCQHCYRELEAENERLRELAFEIWRHQSWEHDIEKDKEVFTNWLKEALEEK